MTNKSNDEKSMAERLKAMEEGNFAKDTDKDTHKLSDSDLNLDQENLLEDASLDIDLKGLAKELEEAKAKAEKNLNDYLRAQAEIQNIQRRASIDIENARKYGLERFARDMLAVVDSLEHGLQVADSAKDTAYHEGMELTLKLCLDTFEKFGIKRIEPAVGETFDPLKHEAISAQVKDDMDANKVLVVAQKGFMLQDRILRPARVIVTRKGA